MQLNLVRSRIVIHKTVLGNPPDKPGGLATVLTLKGIKDDQQGEKRFKVIEIIYQEHDSATSITLAETIIRLTFEGFLEVVEI